MKDDDERRAYRRRRMDELLAEAETDVARTRAERNKPAPVVDQSRNGFWGGTLLVVILLAVGGVFLMLCLTVGRFTGADYDDAARHGTATVERCDRHGPITWNGFGYYNACTVDITWDDGAGPRVLIDDPGFFQGEKPGDKIEIGQNQGTRGAVSYSRPEAPARGWITAVTVLLGVLAALCFGAIYFILRETIKDIRRSRA